MSESQAMLTTQQFAKKANVSTSTLSKWLRNGKIKGRKNAGKWLIPLEQLELLTSGSAPVPSPSDPTKKAATPPSHAETIGYSIEEFSALTYLTPFGVEQYVKDGRLSGTRKPDGQWYIDSLNLEKATIKRLLRR
jgi:excisionase family DNA binding protein